MSELLTGVAAYAVGAGLLTVLYLERARLRGLHDKTKAYYAPVAIGVGAFLLIHAVSVGTAVLGGLLEEHKAMKAWIIQVQQNSTQKAQQPGEPQASDKDTKESNPAK